MENLLTDTQPGQALDPAQLNLSTENPPVEKNEPAPAPPPNDDGRLKKIIGHATGAFTETLSRLKPGRGRPRKDGSPKKSDTFDAGQDAPDNPRPEIPRPPVAPPPDEKTNLALDGKIIEVAAEVTIFSWAESAKTAIELYGIRGGVEKIDLRPYIEPLGLTAREKECIIMLIQFFVKKYQLTIEYLPEIIAALTVLGIASRYALTGWNIHQLVLEKKKLTGNTAPKN